MKHMLGLSCYTKNVFIFLISIHIYFSFKFFFDFEIFHKYRDKIDIYTYHLLVIQRVEEMRLIDTN